MTRRANILRNGEPAHVFDHGVWWLVAPMGNNGRVTLFKDNRSTDGWPIDSVRPERFTDPCDTHDYEYRQTMMETHSRCVVCGVSEQDASVFIDDGGNDD
jgi:hypothetical protein